MSTQLPLGLVEKTIKQSSKHATNAAVAVVVVQVGC